MGRSKTVRLIAALVIGTLVVGGTRLLAEKEEPPHHAPSVAFRCEQIKGDIRVVLLGVHRGMVAEGKKMSALQPCVTFYYLVEYLGNEQINALSHGPMTLFDGAPQESNRLTFTSSMEATVDYGFSGQMRDAPVTVQDPKRTRIRIFRAHSAVIDLQRVTFKMTQGVNGVKKEFVFHNIPMPQGG